MKKYLIFTGYFIVALLSLGQFFYGIYCFCRNECRDAYSSGYSAGFNADIATCGFRNATEWVGVGNEEYDVFTRIATGRGDKYWWAETIKLKGEQR